MKRWQKVDNKTKAEIIKLKLDNPNISDREIQKSIPIVKSNKTISKIINNEFTQNTQSYELIINNNISIIETAQNIIFKWLNNLEIKNINDLSKVSNIMYHSVKQNQLITWRWEEVNTNNIIPSNIVITINN